MGKTLWVNPNSEETEIRGKEMLGEIRAHGRREMGREKNWYEVSVRRGEKHLDFRSRDTVAKVTQRYQGLYAIMCVYV